ncbi:MAG: peptidoglycan recognition protein family protein [Bacteroidetes bacterium]|nr:peptidoglycan recognition protein family protein [Bacteroidota bacterium]
MSRFVQSISINKAIGRNISSCSIQLAPAPGETTRDTILNNVMWKSLVMRLMRPYQLIWVKLNRLNSEYTFIGLIDIPKESINQNSAQPSQALTISASSILGKTLISESIVGSQILASFTGKEHEAMIKEWFGQDGYDFMKFSRGLDKDGKSVFLNTPDKAIQWILQNGIRQRKFLVYNDAGQARKVQIGDILDFRGNAEKISSVRVLKNEFLFGPELSIYTGNLWNYLEQCIDSRFYEMFTEIDSYKTDDGTSRTVDKLIIRPIPYSYKKIDRLRQKELDSKGLKANSDEWLYFDDLPISLVTSTRDIRQLNFSITDKEYFNYFTLEYNNSILAPQGSDLSLFGYSPPIINGEGLMEFGLRELKLTSRNPMNFGREHQEYDDARKKKESIGAIEPGALARAHESLMTKREKGLEWYGFPYLENGQIIVPGDETIKLGTRLQIADKEYFYVIDTVDGLKPFSGRGMEYYIQSIQHTWSVGSEFQTNLGLIRGIPVITDNDASDMIYKYFEYIWKTKFDTLPYYRKSETKTQDEINQHATDDIASDTDIKEDKKRQFSKYKSINRPIEKSAFYQDTYFKNQIVLHHTGADGIEGAIAEWNRETDLEKEKKIKIAAHMIIGKDGNVVQTIPDFQQWAYHSSQGGFQDRYSIGIELENWGALILKNGIYYTSVDGKTISTVYTGQVFDNKVEYRGSRYFAAYTEAQINTTFQEVLRLCNKFNIPKRVITDFSLSASYIGFKGIVSHHNFDRNKHNVSPAFPLVELAQYLKDN